MQVMDRLMGMMQMSERDRCTEPLVSVIIPTFNRASVISQAIDSVLQQTFKNYEVIVVDDGSSDGTGELLARYYNDRIIYIGDGKNRGLSAARNLGIKAARGEYVAFLDDDDVWLPLKLEKQVALMENNESLGLVYCNSVSVNERDECIAQTSGTTRGAIHEHLLAANCLGPPSGVMVRDRVFAKAGYFDENLSALEDWDLWIRLTQWFAVDVVEQPLLKYRVHSSNMSNNLDRMEHATFSVLNKYWPAGDGEGPGGGRRNEVYSNHCVNFAWKRYALGQREAFRKLLLQALAYDPCHQIVIGGDGLEHKEEALFEVMDIFWRSRQGSTDGAHKRSSYAAHYSQLAWQYYHRGSMGDFRRCLGRLFRAAFPFVPVRLVIPFMKSLLGKRLSDSIHAARKGVFLVPTPQPGARPAQRLAGIMRTVWMRYGSLLVRHRAIRRYLDSHRIRKLHLGCGGTILEGWFNTDLEPAQNILFIDVRKELPFADCTFDHVFLEHLIEHLDYRDGLRLLQECFRVMKPSGSIRIATPDLRFLIELYTAHKSELQQHYIAWSVQTFIPHAPGAQDAHVINNFFRNWGHRFIYDDKTLRIALQKAGFIDLRSCAVGESEREELRALESHGRVMPGEFNRLETMVVEACKPAGEERGIAP